MISIVCAWNPGNAYLQNDPFFANIKFTNTKGKPGCQPSLWPLNLSGGEKNSCRFEALILLAMIAELIQTLNGIRKGGRTAIVSTIDVTFGVARMLEALTNTPNDDLAYELKVFRKIKAAVRWLDKT